MVSGSGAKGKGQMTERRKTRSVRVRDVVIGGGAPISVQSMTTEPLTDVDATLEQIARLAARGCAIVRVAVRNAGETAALRAIVEKSPLPVVADVHFAPTLALACVEAGADKVRVNPGNMRSKEKMREVARACAHTGTAVRIGVNSGSIRRRSGLKVAEDGDLVELMVEGALTAARLFEEEGCGALVLSLKGSNVLETVAAYRAAATQCDLPMHVGITAAGPPRVGAIRSAVGIGLLLAQGIGDTIRVSLTGPPEPEVDAGLEILRSLELAPRGLTILSCPTCGRCEADLPALVAEVEERLAGYCEREITVAVMGCVVNGPGEAQEADVGVAMGHGAAMMFESGRAPARLAPERCVDALVEAVERIAAGRDGEGGR